MRVLITGGSGYIASHVLELALRHGHSVVTTVRSQGKADRIRAAHPKYTQKDLDFVIVEDIAQPGAFDKAVISDPPFEAVIHTASPFHFQAEDIARDLLTPAVHGTKGILQAIKSNAPTVRRVVITSSFAAIIDPSKGLWPEHTYSEEDWSPLTWETSLENQGAGYRGSKKLAEKAAWDFVENEKPNFTISTMNPPLVLGPIVNYLNSLDAVNTSNQRTRDCLLGKWKEGIPDTGTFIWVDVRDLALAHVKAMEIPEAANKRFFIVADHFCNKQIADVVRKHFPKYHDVLPPADTTTGTLPKEIFKINNERCVKTLGIKFTPFETSIVDLVKSLQAAGA